MNNLFIVSDECTPFYPRKCIILRRVKSLFRKENVLIEIFPSLYAGSFGTNYDVSKLVLTPVLGVSILKSITMTNWPIPVYIAYSDDIYDTNVININRLSTVGYCDLYPSENEAVMKSHGYIIDEFGVAVKTLMDNMDFTDLNMKYTTLLIDQKIIDPKIPFDKRRKNILMRILYEFPNSVLKMDYNPSDSMLFSSWIRKKDGWIVPADIHFDQFFEWGQDKEWFLFKSNNLTLSDLPSSVHNLQPEEQNRLMEINEHIYSIYSNGMGKWCMVLNKVTTAFDETSITDIYLPRKSG